jgi:adenine-specific DNA-methyltransferase
MSGNFPLFFNEKNNTTSIMRLKGCGKVEKIIGKSLDLTQENIKRLKELFPEALTEDKIDFDKLRLILGDEVETSPERYEFRWNGKNEAIKLSQTPSMGTLRPDKESSKNWDTTENLYIEGDNLEVLKLLQKSYFGKIKMIYIDPPYNTGKKFTYKDNFHDDSTNYKKNTNQSTKANSETSGRFHTNWLNMMYPRLKLARNLLKEDGVIFISIDENENANLRKISDEIFGENNLVSEITWEKKFAPQNDAKYFSLNHEYILCYAKNKKNFKRNLLPMTTEQIDRYKNPDNDPRGSWQSDNLTVSTYNEKYDFPITTPSGKIINPPHGRCWRTSKEKFDELVSDNRIWFGKTGSNTPRIKRFLSEVQQGKTPISLWYHDEVGHTQEASKELKDLFNGKKYFDYPKPVKLIYRMAYISTNPDDIILDFFSGSGTTAHAIMQLNAEDNGHRKFIMVQIPERLEEKSEAYKDGYKNICEIGKERIRRAGARITEEFKNKKIDTGFKVLKLDDSNTENWDTN